MNMIIRPVLPDFSACTLISLLITAVSVIYVKKVIIGKESKY